MEDDIKEMRRDIKEILQQTARIDARAPFYTERLNELKTDANEIVERVQEHGEELARLDERNPSRKTVGFGGIAGFVSGAISGFLAHFTSPS